MPDNLYDALSHLPVYSAYVIIAIFGGIARYLNAFVEGKPFSARVFLASATVAGFSGLMFGLVGVSLQMPAIIQLVMAGTGGFFGEQTMKLVLEYTSSKL